MQEQQTQPASLSQLVAAAGLTGPTVRDDAAKVPGEIDALIAKSEAQLGVVKSQLKALATIRAQVEESTAEKAEEEARITKTLGGLYEARSAISKP